MELSETYFHLEDASLGKKDSAPLSVKEEKYGTFLPLNYCEIIIILNPITAVFICGLAIVYLIVRLILTIIYYISWEGSMVLTDLARSWKPIMVSNGRKTTKEDSAKEGNGKPSLLFICLDILKIITISQHLMALYTNTIFPSDLSPILKFKGLS